MTKARNLADFISDATVATAEIENSAVTTDKLADNAVTAAKLDETETYTTAGLTVNGNIAATGTVDGRDVAADGTKLDGIEASADVTDTTNVTAAGALMTTGGSVTGNVSFGDSDKAIFGGELQIYSDATHARIVENGTGQLKIQGNNMQLLTSDGTSTYLEGNASTSAVTLYHASNSPRLTTTSTGVDITGTLTSDGLTVDGTSLVNGSGTITSGGSAGIDTRLTLANTGNGGAGRGVALSLSPAGSSNSVESVSLIGLQESVSATANNSSFVAQVANSSGTLTQRLRINNGGDISFYEDTGTTAKFFWSAADERLGLGSTTPSASLHLPASSASTYANGIFIGAGTGDLYGLSLWHNTSSNTTSYIDNRYDNAAAATKIRMRTQGTPVDAMTILGSGNVGIGTSSPSAYGAGYTTVGVNGSTMSGVEGFVNDTLTSYTQTYAAQTLVGTKTATPLVFVTNDTQRMQIDSSGNVGIGTSSGGSGPQDNLHISSSLPTIRLEDSDVSGGAGYSLIHTSSNGNIEFKADPDNVRSSTDIRFAVDGTERMRIDSSGNVNLTGLSNGTLNFAGGNTSGGSKIQAWNDAGNANGYLAIEGYSSEYMRIDSSGNVIIGGTSAGQDGAVTLSNTGYIQARIDNDTVAYFDRTGAGDDGEVIRIQQNGATVGSIGSVASGANLYMSVASGVGLGIGGDNLYPVNASGNSTDGALDIGDATARFQDLYLSGGVYLGGTGSANKLDDYEEGTWTPSFVATTTDPTISYDQRFGRYTKIGNTVYVYLYIKVLTASGGSGNMNISGLPYNNSSNVPISEGNSFQFNYIVNTNISTGRVLAGYFRNNDNKIYCVVQGAGNTAGYSVSDFTTNNNLSVYGSGMYTVSS